MRRDIARPPRPVIGIPGRGMGEPAGESLAPVTPRGDRLRRITLWASAPWSRSRTGHAEVRGRPDARWQAAVAAQSGFPGGGRPQCDRGRRDQRHLGRAGRKTGPVRLTDLPSRLLRHQPEPHPQVVRYEHLRQPSEEGPLQRQPAQEPRLGRVITASVPPHGSHAHRRGAEGSGRAQARAVGLCRSGCRLETISGTEGMGKWGT